MDTRTERDSMGDIKVPQDALYGAQTMRALHNFPISDQRIPVEVIHVLGMIKSSAARINRDLGLLDTSVADAIIRAAEEVYEGLHDEQFPVDVFQTGSGTSTNMNANEVIANRANIILGGQLGEKYPVHPNDHVNLGQSSNDVFPSAMHVATVEAIRTRLIPALHQCIVSLETKTREFDGIVKVGRTHLQDAVPIRVGQEFSGYSYQISENLQWIQSVMEGLYPLALGGTAVGTGLNTHPEFGERTIRIIRDRTGIPFREVENHFAAQASQDPMVRMSGALRDLAVSLIKIANDLRWLGSGPQSGLRELILPPVQPGSSIMPGKVNPVIAESMLMVCVQVMGLDASVSNAGSWGTFELNTMLPLIISNVLFMIRILSNGLMNFTHKLLNGVRLHIDVLRDMAEHSLGLAVVLAPAIGYDAAAKIAHTASTTGKPIRQVALEEEILDARALDRLFDLEKLTEPGIPRMDGK